jgi:hypothetical protein
VAQHYFFHNLDDKSHQDKKQAYTRFVGLLQETIVKFRNGEDYKKVADMLIAKGHLLNPKQSLCLGTPSQRANCKFFDISLEVLQLHLEA